MSALSELTTSVDIKHALFKPQRPNNPSPRPKSPLGQHVSVVPLGRKQPIITPVVRPEVQYTGPLGCTCTQAGDVQCLGGGGQDCPFWGTEKTAPPAEENGGLTGWLRGAFMSKKDKEAKMGKSSEAYYDKESKRWVFEGGRIRTFPSVESLQQCFDDDDENLVGGWCEQDGKWEFVHGNGKYVKRNGKPQWELDTEREFYHAPKIFQSPRPEELDNLKIPAFVGGVEL